MTSHVGNIGNEPLLPREVDPHAGNLGVMGLRGYTGSTGMTGSGGGTGPDGGTGALGLTGPNGQTGANGLTGAGGNTGANGNTGAVGSTGADGATGQTGIVGQTGAGGQTGSTGELGQTGSTGEPGATGEGGVAGALSDLSDVSAIPAPTKNDALKWNGSKWVAAAYNYNFAFSVASFTDDQADPQLIGSGTWKAAAAINFAATYLNGPPTEAHITCASWAGQLNLSTPYAAVASSENTAYPATKGSTITFSFSATNGETGTNSTSVTFYNNIAWGTSAKASGYVSSDVLGLTGSAISSTQARSVAINATSGQYLIFAFPSTYASIHATGFLFNGVSCPFQVAETVSVTNSAGFTEDYKVYRSTLAALGNSTLTTSTSSNLIDPIYHGISTVSGSYSEANVKALATSVISNTKGRTITATAGAGDYIVYALPVRLGTVTFTVGGFEGGFNSPETVAITNINGYTENYYVYRSANDNLGSTTVVVA